MISPRIQSNPFYQPARQWQIRIHAHVSQTHWVEDAFADMALSLSSFEANEDSVDWWVEVLTDEAPSSEMIEGRLAIAGAAFGLPTLAYEVQTLDARDWVSEVEKTFRPLHVGRFYVHGSHATALPPPGALPLLVNAGAAFGSGEHATTSGCLLALSRLAKRRHFTRPLDMGCGSGILAIAAARLFHTPVAGVDIDPVSVQVARANARVNRVAHLTRFSAADGYASDLVRRRAPFDLIIANILARPLVRMAPQLAAVLAPGGTVLLSGLLGTQEKMVLAAHRAQGLRLRARVCIGPWHTLILE